MTETFELKNLIGIPFKLNSRDFSGCDCRGIVWLYYHHIKNINMPFSDGKRVLMRNPKYDTQRMIDGLKSFGSMVTRFKDLQEGDTVIMKGLGSVGAMGVCINNKQLLHMDKVVGSCLTKLEYLRSLFIIGYRPYV